MTALATAPASAPPGVAGPAAGWRRALASGLVLLCCYVGVSFLMDPAGFLGTDTGGKVATLRVMDGADPDLGYWAERWDPDGSLHPLWYTTHVGDRWVNVTTLPMLELGRPLYAAGGYRAALLLPMLGGVAAAFAARALARRLAQREGWTAFWVVGLASPVAVYALDFWEHTAGLALLAWAAVALVDVIERRAGWRAAGLAGLGIGAAGTMRTEALAYGAVWVAVACGWRLWADRDLRPPLRLGLAAAAGVILPLSANAALEQAILGQSLRTGRATGTVLGSGGAEGSRLVEALVTFLSPAPTLSADGWLLGTVLLALLAFLAVRTLGRADVPTGERLPVLVAAGAVLAVYALARADGLGFVPGLVAATPLAAVALALGWREAKARPVLALALLPLPLVWRFQFTGGAAPQWAGRYILVTGFLLLVVGVCLLPRLVPWARIAGIALAAAVTLSGVAWLHVRSHDVADAVRTLESRNEDVLVSRIHHLAREGGATYGDRRWLTAIEEADVRRAADVVRDAGGRSFALISFEGDAPPELPGFTATTDATTVEFLDGVDLEVVTYTAD